MREKEAQLARRRGVAPAFAPTPQPATLMLWLSLLFPVLNLLPAAL